MAQRLQTIEQGNHIIAVYPNKDEKFNEAFAFLKDGLETMRLLSLQPQIYQKMKFVLIMIQYILLYIIPISQYILPPVISLLEGNPQYYTKDVVDIIRKNALKLSLVQETMHSGEAEKIMLSKNGWVAARSHDI